MVLEDSYPDPAGAPCPMLLRQVEVSAASFRALRHASPLLRAWLVRFPDPSRPITILKVRTAPCRPSWPLLPHACQHAQASSSHCIMYILPMSWPARAPSRDPAVSPCPFMQTSSPVSTTVPTHASFAAWLSGP